MYVQTPQASTFSPLFKLLQSAYSFLQIHF